MGSRRALITVALLAAFGNLAAAPVMAATPSPSPIPCLKTLKLGGSLYLDADTTVQSSEVGAQAGITDPNPAYCGIQGGRPAFAHRGHPTSEEVVFDTGGQPELFRSGGNTGLPMQGTVRWLVLVLALGILGFAAIPAILAHVRQPPIEVGNKEDDIYDPPKIDVDGD